ncbi:hypothetical protein [Limimaricola soesokkakensis]|uniref:hypothetical protein n=1 Tax=Limimaricola soesokkakensis TaxID=1343159 RepID=UPI003515D7D4
MTDLATCTSSLTHDAALPDCAQSRKDLAAAGSVRQRAVADARRRKWLADIQAFVDQAEWHDIAGTSLVETRSRFDVAVCRWSWSKATCSPDRRLVLTA